MRLPEDGMRTQIYCFDGVAFRKQSIREMGRQEYMLLNLTWQFRAVQLPPGDKDGRLLPAEVLPERFGAAIYKYRRVVRALAKKEGKRL